MAPAVAVLLAPKISHRGSTYTAPMPEIAQETADLLFLGLDHGIDSVRGGGPLTPFVITERSGERSLARYLAETLEASIAQAVASIKANPVAPGDLSMLVYDGFLTMPDGNRYNAIFAEVVEAGGLVTRMAQRYRPRGRLRRFDTVGNAALLPGAQGKL